jgi:hypothetical protein
MTYYHPNGRLKIGEDEFKIDTDNPENTFTLGGTWNIMPEYSSSVKDSVLELNFRAQNVFLVMKSSDGNPKTVKISLDGKNPKEFSGNDAEGGLIKVNSDRLYELINLPQVENKKLRLEFEDGVEIFAFTFG